MGTLSVTGTPQAVYPDGLQDAFIIKNNGPYTIYVDSDSSIDVRSHSVPPTGVMAWDANRPLWMLGSSLGSSEVTLTRNSTPADFNNATDAVLLTQHTSLTSLSNFQTPVMECTAWETVVITFTSPTLTLTTQAISVNTVYQGVVQWLDLAGNIIGYDNFKLPFQAETSQYAPTGILQYLTPTAGSRLTLPVRGNFFRVVVYVPAIPPVGTIVNTKIVGTTRVLPMRMSYTLWENDPYMGNYIPNAPAPDYISPTGFGFNTYAYGGVRGWQSVAIPNLSDTVRVRALIQGNCTIAGLVYFTDAVNTAIQLSVSTTVPAGNFTYIDLTCQIPLLEPVTFIVNVNPAVGAGVPTSLSFTYL